ncbi:DUF6473 family protein [Pseudooceanicola nitratireducens]|uniref:DUF6473 family protein n=1 Tax=Pseudooceanicola nitratireducens TaxID=517719 RepID=UPI003C7B45B1
MTCEKFGPRPIDYLPCRYGTSRTLYRGPRADLRGPYTLFLGGTETYGKFLRTPYPALVQERLGVTSVNLGLVNGGPDVYLHDRTATNLSLKAQATVMQVPTVQNLSNRYYSVHPRRNDRFLRASPVLRTIFRDVDFSEFHFTGHLMRHLQHQDDEMFLVLLVELRKAWVARMEDVIDRLAGPVILIWFDAHDCRNDDGPDPLKVTHDMIEALRPKVQDILYAPAPAPALSTARGDHTDGMIFSPMEASAARQMLGLQAHIDLARILSSALRDRVPGMPSRQTMPQNTPQTGR